MIPILKKWFIFHINILLSKIFQKLVIAFCNICTRWRVKNGFSSGTHQCNALLPPRIYKKKYFLLSVESTNSILKLGNRTGSGQLAPKLELDLWISQISWGKIKFIFKWETKIIPQGNFDFNSQLFQKTCIHSWNKDRKLIFSLYLVYKIVLSLDFFM